jgi:hypothetical protein
LFVALGWGALEDLGAQHHVERLHLLEWACEQLRRIADGPIKERLRRMALDMPIELNRQNERFTRAFR